MYETYDQLFNFVKSNMIPEVLAAFQAGANPNYAISRNEQDTVGNLAIGAEIINFTWNDSLLFSAIEDGKLEMVQLLVDAGADIERLCGRFSTTALGNALLVSNEAIALYLIDNGANVNGVIKDIWWRHYSACLKEVSFKHNKNVSFLHLVIEKNLSIKLIQNMLDRQANLCSVAQYQAINFDERIKAEWCTTVNATCTNIIFLFWTLGLLLPIMFCGAAACPSDGGNYVNHTPLSLAQFRNLSHIIAILEAPIRDVDSVPKEGSPSVTNNGATFYFSSVGKSGKSLGNFQIQNIDRQTVSPLK